MTHLQNMMLEATQFRMLRDVFRQDPNIGPQAAEIMRGVFRMGGEDPVIVAQNRTHRRK